jgi:hypothetical protein
MEWKETVLPNVDEGECSPVRQFLHCSNSYLYLTWQTQIHWSSLFNENGSVDLHFPLRLETIIEGKTMHLCYETFDTETGRIFQGFQN